MFDVRDQYPAGCVGSAGNAEAESACVDVTTAAVFSTVVVFWFLLPLLVFTGGRGI